LSSARSRDVVSTITRPSASTSHAMSHARIGAWPKITISISMT